MCGKLCRSPEDFFPAPKVHSAEPEIHSLWLRRPAIPGLTIPAAQEFFRRLHIATAARAQLRHEIVTDTVADRAVRRYGPDAPRRLRPAPQVQSTWHERRETTVHTPCAARSGH